MPRGLCMSSEERDSLRSMVAQGLSIRKMADHLKRTRSCIRNNIKRLSNEGSHYNKIINCVDRLAAMKKHLDTELIEVARLLSEVSHVKWRRRKDQPPLPIIRRLTPLTRVSLCKRLCVIPLDCNKTSLFPTNHCCCLRLILHVHTQTLTDWLSAHWTCWASARTRRTCD